jgi:hypothetical protein
MGCAILILRACRLWCGRRKETDHRENPGVKMRIILKWILKKNDGMAYIGFMWLRTGTSGVLLSVQ